MCGGERPEDYKVPDIYLPDQQEVLRIQQEELAMLQYEQVTVKSRGPDTLRCTTTGFEALLWGFTFMKKLSAEELYAFFCDIKSKVKQE